MHKSIFSRLSYEWRRNRNGHVRSKFLLIIQALLLALLLAYVCLSVFHAGWLFVLLLVIGTLRFLYLHAKGDWSDLAEQLGLKCWHCHYIFNNETRIKQVFDSNACPHCQHSIYEKK